MYISLKDNHKQVNISMILYYLDEMKDTGSIELLINTMMERFKDETCFLY